MSRQDFFATEDESHLSTTLKAIQAYQENVLRGRIRCSHARCPLCGAVRDKEPFFRRHAVRDRGLRVIVGRLAHLVPVRLVRWRCPVCRGTFADYPPFMVQHKQYAAPEMRARSHNYVKAAGISYRDGVTESGLPVYHAEKDIADAGSAEEEKEAEDLPVLAHTTLFRWITTLGKTARRQPGTEDEEIAPHKYRTQKRKRLLSACFHFCNADNPSTPTSRRSC